MVKSYRFINVYGANHKVARLYKDYGAESLLPNAHLIAAAPDLLHALGYMTALFECSCRDECVPDCPVAVARAAFAKAEGRS